MAAQLLENLSSFGCISDFGADVSDLSIAASQPKCALPDLETAGCGRSSVVIASFKKIYDYSILQVDNASVSIGPSEDCRLRVPEPWRTTSWQGLEKSVLRKRYS